ncbi:F-box domain-containing protein [Fusarium oxysporum f. sp. phaseoli]
MSNVLRSRRPTTGPDAGKASGVPKRTSPQRTFMSLPTEIHLAISDFLIYPDALSLKHTNAYFYSLVDTGINLKVEWLVERRSLHLECPNDRRCDLGSDLRFCRGSVPSTHATKTRTCGM